MNIAIKRIYTYMTNNPDCAIYKHNKHKNIEYWSFFAYTRCHHLTVYLENSRIHAYIQKIP